MHIKNKLSLVVAVMLFLASSWSSLSLADDDFDYQKYKPEWLGFAGNFDVAYRKTQFFEPEHNVGVGTWDSRIEFWLPPFKKGNNDTNYSGLSYGLYLRFAGISSTSNEAWENGWLAVPGFGAQVYPFSMAQFRQKDSLVGKYLGPLRLLFEYNRLHYWGGENSWRPNDQFRVGAEYWRNLNSNNLKSPWWAEIWSGLYWVSANEFDPHYDTLTYAASVRTGIRLPTTDTDAISLSLLTPYIVLESSVNKNSAYYWENRFLIGGGLRITPNLKETKEGLPGFLNRFVVYAEYNYIAAYYRDTPPSGVPDYDVRAGINFSLGDWYH